MDVFQLPILHVEARIKSNGDGIIIRTDLVHCLGVPTIIF